MILTFKGPYILNVVGTECAILPIYDQEKILREITYHFHFGQTTIKRNRSSPIEKEK